jgi:chromosome segregation ATPase
MDVEKTMEFILSQQAGFAARHAEFEVRQARFDERLEKLATIQDNQQKSIFDLTQVVRTLATHAAETDQKISHLTDNMNALIKVVDDLVRRDNGRPSA